MQHPDDAKRVKQATDLVDLVGSLVPLQRAGSSFKALCPFHEEKTPSFHVFPQNQVFRCFGCNVSGDAITFVERFQKLPFRDALEWLADRAGVALSRAPIPGAGADRKSAYKALEAACAYFEGLLPRAPAALLRALDARGLTEPVRREWRIGLAPSGWQTLHERLLAQGFAPDAQIAAGLVKRHETGRVLDRFRDRVTFPIRDVLGRVVGFGARLLPGVEEGEEHGPKYLNSPESEIFQKRHILYGLDKFPRGQAQENEPAGGAPVVMEGYTDVILAHAAGMRRAVATLGTALGKEHAQVLRRYADRVLLLYDGDEAGLRASERGVGVLLEEGLEVRVAALPDGLDPADYVLARGAEAFLREVGVGVEFLSFLGERVRARARTLERPEDRAGACDEVLRYVVKIESPIQRDLWSRKVASWFSLSESRVAERLADLLGKTRAPRTSGPPGEAAAAPRTRDQRAAEELLGGLLRDPSLLAIVSSRGVPPESLGEARFASVLEAMYACASAGEEADLHAVTARLGDVPWRHLPAELETGAPAQAESAVLGALAYFDRRNVERRARELREQLAEAERRGDRDALTRIQRELVELHRAHRAGAGQRRGTASDPSLGSSQDPASSEI